MDQQLSEIEGFLVESSSTTLRLVADNHMLEFSQEDIFEVIKLSVPEGVVITNSPPVRVKLFLQARLLNACPIAPLRHVSAVGRVPFSLVVRSKSVQVFDSPKFKALEKAFLKEHGL